MSGEDLTMLKSQTNYVREKKCVDHYALTEGQKSIRSADTQG